MNNSDEANKEWKEVLEWAVDESSKVRDRLTKEGKIVGLDGNENDYAYIHEEVNRKLEEIQRKYF